MTKETKYFDDFDFEIEIDIGIKIDIDNGIDIAIDIDIEIYIDIDIDIDIDASTVNSVHACLYNIVSFSREKYIEMLLYCYIVIMWQYYNAKLLVWYIITLVNC